MVKGNLYKLRFSSKAKDPLHAMAKSLIRIRPGDLAVYVLLVMAMITPLLPEAMVV